MLRAENRHGFRRDRSADASVGARRGVRTVAPECVPAMARAAAAFVERTFERCVRARDAAAARGWAEHEETSARRPPSGVTTRDGDVARRGGDSDSDVSLETLERRLGADATDASNRRRTGWGGAGASRVAWARLTRRRRSEREGQTRRRARTENVSSSSPRRTSSREEASRNGESDGRAAGESGGRASPSASARYSGWVVHSHRSSTRRSRWSPRPRV